MRPPPSSTNMVTNERSHMTITREDSPAPRRGPAKFFGWGLRTLSGLLPFVMVVLAASVVTSVAIVESANANPPGNAGSIVFTSDRKAAGGSNVYRMDADGRGPMKPITESPGERLMPAPSPDGSSIAFVRSGLTGIPNIYRMDADGSDESPLTTDLLFNTDPAWFPNSRKIVFSRGEDIYAMALDASGEPAGRPTLLTRGPGADRQPVVSPDGKRIAFASDRDGDFDIYVMKSAPEGRRNMPLRLTDNTAFDFAPDWSPDGERIAFSGGTAGEREIYVMRADGSDPTNLTGNAADDSDPAWSPDGERIAFTSTRTGDAEIWSMGADGSDATNLTGSPNSEDLQPDWQPLP
jgi:Tol biopolymer transport system component